MNYALEAKLQKKIRTKALQHSEKLRLKKIRLQNTNHTLDALHQVTGLPRRELKAIADDVSRSFEVSREEFFSIRNQLLATMGVTGLVIISGWLLFMI